MVRRKGFTLAEVLVAVVIIVVVIGAVTLIEAKNIKFGASTKYQTQANGVANEGLNIVQSISDFAKLGGSKCGALSNCCDDPANSIKCPPGNYYLNGSAQLIKCSHADCKPEGDILINGKTFTRKIIIP